MKVERAEFVWLVFLCCDELDRMPVKRAGRDFSRKIQIPKREEWLREKR
jgi:hypothetical protein